MSKGQSMYVGLRRIARRVVGPRQVPVTYDAHWYDDQYAKPESSYRRHYTQSIDYFLWTVLVDRTPEDARVLEIGCGSGQLARYLNERGVARYRGFDYSERAIAIAQQAEPGLDFRVADALATPLLAEEWYDHVISTEVMEHVEPDLDIITRIRPGVRCLITVPSFPYKGHVRHFDTAESVAERYGPFFENTRVTVIPKNPEGRRFYIIDGVRARTLRTRPASGG